MMWRAGIWIKEDIAIVHDFAEPGWEQRGNLLFSDFISWLRQAVEDLIKHGVR